jgi:hypothetical protein
LLLTFVATISFPSVLEKNMIRADAYAAVILAIYNFIDNVIGLLFSF